METILFKGITKSLLADLKKANKHIKVAVAWFTNFELYNVLLSKLKDGLTVTVIIINDPINNREGVS